MNKKCGFVALAGRANAGKSTLLNAIIGQKVSIVSKVPQTTRLRIKAILNEAQGQIVFVDRPGLYLSKKRMARMLSQTACDIKDDADVIVYVIDLQRPPGKEEQKIAEVVKVSGKPVILVFNKRDLGQQHAETYIEFWKKIPPEGDGNLKYFLPLSALTGKGVKELVNLLFEMLPEHPLFYPEDMITDLPQKLNAGEIIREKVFMFALEELPHSTAVLINEITHRTDKLVYINADILVQRNSQKVIIVGKQGDSLKKIGQLAREDLEKLFKKKVYLDLWVKVREDWQQDDNVLKQLGIIY
ncbi:MAG: GTPase Era [Candidatus Omnitrophota bacterium]